MYIYIINKTKQFGTLYFSRVNKQTSNQGSVHGDKHLLFTTGGLEMGVVRLFGGNMINKTKTKTRSGTAQSVQVTPELAD